MLVKFPAPILRESLKFLSSADVLSVSTVGKEFRKVVDHDAMWEHLFYLEYPVKSLLISKPHHMHWKEYFHQALRIYTRMRKAIRLISGARKKANYTEQVLSTDRKIPEFIKSCAKVNIEICSFFKCINFGGNSKHLIGLFGELCFYDWNISYTPMLEIILSQNAGIKEMIKTDLFPVITDCSKYFICVDLDNICGKGSTALVGLQEGARSLLYMYPDIVSYLEDLAQKFAGDYYTNKKGTGVVSLFKREPDTRTVTNGICIDCVSTFVPQESYFNYPNANKFFYTYQIRITATDQVKPAQLTARKWVIKTDGVLVDTVQGPGVIGLYPKVFPKCPNFAYESCTSHSKPVGTMEGGFFFTEKDTGNEIFAEIDPFEQRFPNNYEIVYFEKPFHFFNMH